MKIPVVEVIVDERSCSFNRNVLVSVPDTKVQVNDRLHRNKVVLTIRKVTDVINLKASSGAKILVNG